MAGPDLTGPWHGVPRAEIDWAPSIDPDLCNGCGLCVTSCGRKVFDYDFDARRSFVARPLQCMVGCVTCENLCPRQAIGFPPRSYLARIIKDNKVLADAGHKLDEMKNQQQGGNGHE